jgi:hypothetical protein
MKIIKLNSTHKEKIKPLFSSTRFMGVSTEKEYFIGTGQAIQFDEFYHKTFILTYLSDAKNYHAYGCLVNKEITSLMAFYESNDDASWYWNQVRSINRNPSEIKALLDAVINYNEAQGRLKFYSMFPLKYRSIYRRLAFSKSANERYDYFDEYQIEEKHQCMFTLPWQILYNRTLVPIDTIVRCTFLKQKYRDDLYQAGRL